MMMEMEQITLICRAKYGSFEGAKITMGNKDRYLGNSKAKSPVKGNVLITSQAKGVSFESAL